MEQELERLANENRRLWDIAGLLSSILKLRPDERPIRFEIRTRLNKGNATSCRVYDDFVAAKQRFDAIRGQVPGDVSLIAVLDEDLLNDDSL